MPRLSRKRKLLLYSMIATAIVLAPTIASSIAARPFRQLASQLPVEIAAAKAEALPMSLEDLDPHLPPRENAWTYYQKAGAISRPIQSSFLGLKTPRLVRLQIDKIRKDYTQHQSVLELLREGSEKSRCYLPIQDPGSGSPVRAQLDQWSKTLVTFAYLQIHDGNDIAAGHCLRTAVRLEYHLRQQPFWGYARGGDVRRALTEILHRLKNPTAFLKALGDWKTFGPISFKEEAAREFVWNHFALESQWRDEVKRLTNVRKPWDMFAGSQYPVFLSPIVARDAARCEMLALERKIWGIAKSSRTNAAKYATTRALLKTRPTEHCHYYPATGAAQVLTMREFRQRLVTADKIVNAALRLVVQLHESGRPRKSFVTADADLLRLQARNEIVYRTRSAGFDLYWLGLNSIDEGGPGSGSDDIGLRYDVPKPGAVAPFGDTGF